MELNGSYLANGTFPHGNYACDVGNNRYQAAISHYSCNSDVDVSSISETTSSTAFPWEYMLLKPGIIFE